MIFEATNSYMSEFYGNFYDEAISYIELSIYDKDQNVIGDVIRIDK